MTHGVRAIDASITLATSHKHTQMAYTYVCIIFGLPVITYLLRKHFIESMKIKQTDKRTSLSKFSKTSIASLGVTSALGFCIGLPASFTSM